MDPVDNMVERSAPSAERRGAVNTKITSELRLRLETAAADSGRTLGAEIELRLANSFDDPLMAAFKHDAAAYVRREPAAAALLGAIAETFKSVVEVSRRRKFSEVETRTALRASLDRLKFFYLWLGEESSPYPGGYKAKSKTYNTDMPPGPMGHALASSTVSWNAAWNDEPVPAEVGQGRISNFWSGDGQTVELQQDLPDSDAQEIDEQIRAGRSIADIMAERGWKEEDPENLDKYVSDGR